MYLRVALVVITIILAVFILAGLILTQFSKADDLLALLVISLAAWQLPMP